MRWAQACALALLLTVAPGALAWETYDEAVKQAAEKIFDKQIYGVGTFASKYPDDHPVAELQGQVVASPDYFAPCFANGDILMLAMPVSQHWHNALSSRTRNATFSIGSNPDPSVADPRHASRHGKWEGKRPSWRKGMPSKNRMTLFGHVEDIEDGGEAADLAKCYFSYHPDSTHWGPGSGESPHESHWVRFVVDKLYHVGGFGDEHAIGFLSLDKYAAEVAALKQRIDRHRGSKSKPKPKQPGMTSPLHLFGENVFETEQARQGELVLQEA